MTPADYLLAVREGLQEPVADIWTDVQLYRYLTWAGRKVWRKLTLSVEDDWYVDESSAISLVADQQEYDLPSDLVRFAGLERVHSNQDLMRKIPKWKRMQHEGLTDTTTLRAYPQLFYLNLPKVGIVPKPTANLADAVVVHYVAEHPVIEDGGADPRFTGNDTAERLTVVRAMMFAKNFNETIDSGLAAEWRDGLLDLLHDYSQGSDEPVYREPMEDGI